MRVWMCPSYTNHPNSNHTTQLPITPTTTLIPTSTTAMDSDTIVVKQRPKKPAAATKAKKNATVAPAAAAAAAAEKKPDIKKPAAETSKNYKTTPTAPATADKNPQTKGSTAEVPETPTRKRKSAAGRTLIRWDFEKDQLLLLALEFECSQKGISLPWQDAVQHVLPGATGQAAVQHLTKVRAYRQDRGQPVPPSSSKRRAARKGASVTPARKRSKIDQPGPETPQVPNTPASRMVFIKTPKNAKPGPSGIGKTQSTVKKTLRRRSARVNKIKEERDVDDSDGEWSPGKPRKGLTLLTSRSGLQVDDEATPATRLGASLRITEDINYGLPEVSDEEMEDDGDANEDDYEEGIPYMEDCEDYESDEFEDNYETREMPPPPKQVFRRSPTARDAYLIHAMDVEDPFSTFNYPEPSESDRSQYSAPLPDMSPVPRYNRFDQGYSNYAHPHDSASRGFGFGSYRPSSFDHTPTPYSSGGYNAQVVHGPATHNHPYHTFSRHPQDVAGTHPGYGYHGPPGGPGSSYNNYTHQPVGQDSRAGYNSFNTAQRAEPYNTVPPPPPKLEGVYLQPHPSFVPQPHPSFGPQPHPSFGPQPPPSFGPLPIHVQYNNVPPPYHGGPPNNYINPYSGPMHGPVPGHNGEIRRDFREEYPIGRVEELSDDALHQEWTHEEDDEEMSPGANGDPQFHRHALGY
ncbi:hypothetical protein MBLNU459_g5411t1 [Dothideomycetes sp. NU459]